MDQDEFSAALKAQVENQNAETEAEEQEKPEQEEASPTGVEEAAAESTGDESVQEPDEEAEAEQAEAPHFDDPDVSKYVERHGGIEQALKVALEAQSVIGRQGQEMGELRRAVEELQARPRTPQSLPDMDQIQENPSQVAAWALQNEQEPVFEAAMAEWYEQDPRAAARFERVIEQEILKADITSSFQPVLEPAREQNQARQLVLAKRELSAQFADAESILESATEAELSGLDAKMVGQLRDENPRAALEVVYRWVKSGRQAQEQHTSESRAQQAQEKREAAVVSSASSTPDREEKTAMDVFKEKMLAPAEYSVLHGLQGGKPL